jgi:hypothetical protein
MAKEFELPFAALISSSAKHSAIVFTFRNADSRAPVVRSQSATFTRYVNSLASNRPRGADTRRVLAWTRIDHSVHENLHRVLISENVHDFEAVFHNPNCHKFLSIVPSVLHQGVHETLHYWALRLFEASRLVPPRRVRQVHCVLLLHSDVVSQGNI